MKTRLPPGVALLLLAPVLGELVSGHQRPGEFFNPLTFLILCLPYGCGAIVCRELAVRWKRGPFSLLLLGMAYGLWEEALVVRSIFNPNWGELGPLAAYGHVWGVTWPYVVLLLHFHTVISIGCSVMLTEILYPDRRGEPWGGKWGLGLCGLVLALWLPAGYLMTQYEPPVLYTVASCACLAGLVVAARVLPARLWVGKRVKAPHPVVFFMTGLINTPVIFLGVYLTAKHDWPSLWVTITGLVGFDVVVLGLVVMWSGAGRAWNDRHRLALIAGLLGFLIFACTLQDFEDEWQGKSVVATLTALALILIWRNVGRRERAARLAQIFET